MTAPRPPLDLPPLPIDADPALRKAHDTVARLGAAMAGLQDSRHTGTAADGDVVATVDGNSVLLDVYLSPRLLRVVAAEELGPLALEAIQQARMASMHAMQAVITEATGAEIPDPASIEAPDQLGFDLR